MANYLQSPSVMSKLYNSRNGMITRGGRRGKNALHIPIPRLIRRCCRIGGCDHPDTVPIRMQEDMTT
jgi:hypothetical protein